jgi:hypothetical protein
VLVTFSVPMDTLSSGFSSSTSRCDAAAVFSADTLSLLGGSGATCSWLDPSVLVIGLGSSQSLVRGSVLAFVDGGLIRATPSAQFNALGAVSVEVQSRAEPPALLRAALGPDGGSVRFVFDRQSSSSFFNGAALASGAVPCALVFAEASLLGNGAQCFWEAPTSMVARLGFAADVGSLVRPVAEVDQSLSSTVACPASSTSVLTLKAGVVTAVRGGVVTTPTTCVAVRRPQSPAAPVLSLAGATRLGSCDGLLVDASGSVDMAGRPLTFTWTINAANGVAADTLVVATPLSTYVLPSQTAQLRVPAVDMGPGAEYAVTCTATTFLGATTTTTVQVFVSSSPLPVVVISGPSFVRAPMNKRVTLQASGSQARTATCTLPAQPLVYTWALLSASRDPDTTEAGYSIATSGLTPLSALVGRDPTVLPLPRLQPGGVYTFEVRAAFARDPSVFNSAQVVVSVLPAGVVAAVAGGDRDVGFTSPLVLDAGSSVDLDETPEDSEPLTYA